MTRTEAAEKDVKKDGEEWKVTRTEKVEDEEAEKLKMTLLSLRSSFPDYRDCPEVKQRGPRRHRDQKRGLRRLHFCRVQRKGRK